MPVERGDAILETRKGAVVNSILLATDGSPSARAATMDAIELAKATGWWLRVLTAWHTPVVNAYGYSPGAYVPLAELTETEKEHAGEVARHAVELARQAGVESTWEVREGHAADVICAAAEEMNAGLIVMGAHGWGAFKRLVFGSVSTGVLHKTTRPVLVARAPAAEAVAEDEVKTAAAA
jgi:nucleotide-binding universal stress UspA family protein